MKELLKEKDPKNRREMVEHIVEAIGCQIERVKEEESVYNEGDHSRLASRCTICNRYARLAGSGFWYLHGLHVGGYYACGQCRKEGRKPGD